MNKYLSSDLKFISDPKAAVKSAISFTLGMLPKDLPFNTGYGVEIPKDYIVKDFCKNYSNNLSQSLSYLGLNVNVESVDLVDRELVVKIKFNDNDIETWRLSI